MSKLLKKKGIYTQLNYKLLLYCSILMVVFFGVNFGIEFATDTYSTFGEADTWKWMLYENGRVLNALVYYLFELLHVPGGYIYKLSYLTALFFGVLSSYLFASPLLSFIKKEWVASFVAFLTILNFYVIEYFLFIEKGLFLIAIFFCVAAFRLTLEYLKNKKLLYLLPSLFCLLMAVFMYQTMLGLFVVLCLPFIAYYSKSIKEFFSFNLIVALLYGIPMGIGFFITNVILGSDRVGDPSFQLSNISSVFQSILNISINRWTVVPAYTFLLFFLLCCCLFLMTILYGSKENKEKNGINILLFLYIILGTYFVSFFPQLTGISSLYLPRVIYPYGAVFGILLTYCILAGKNEFQNRAALYYSLCFILLALSCSQYLSFQSVFIDRYRCNQSDYYYCQILSYQIEKYEQESGNTIDTICFYNDQNVLWWERGYDESTLNTRAQSCGWSNLTSINHYLEKNYVKGDPQPEYEEYFNQYDWGTYSEEQLIFEENILHLCVY